MRSVQPGTGTSVVPYPTGPVGEESVQHFSRASAVQNAVAIVVRPLTANLGGPSLTGAGVNAQIQFGAGRAVGVGQQPGKQGGQAVKNSRLVLLQDAKHVAWGRAAGQQHGWWHPRLSGRSAHCPRRKQKTAWLRNTPRRFRVCPARLDQKAWRFPSSGCGGAPCLWVYRWSRWNKVRKRARR